MLGTVSPPGQRGFLGAITNLHGNRTEEEILRERQRKEAYARELGTAHQLSHY